MTLDSMDRACAEFVGKGSRRSSIGGRMYLDCPCDVRLNAPLNSLLHAHLYAALPPKQIPHQPKTTSQLSTGDPDVQVSTSIAFFNHLNGPAKTSSSAMSGEGRVARVLSDPLLVVEVAGKVGGNSGCI